MASCQEKAAGPFAALNTSGGAENKTNTIVSGHEAGPSGRFAKQVALLNVYRSDSGSRCTATFIDPHIVLTAAHCLTPGWITKIEVAFETNDNQVTFKTDGVKYRVHPKYNPSGDDVSNDLALIKTQEALPSDHLLTLLGTKSYRAGSVVTAVGFGLDQYTIPAATVLDPVLRYVYLNIGAFDHQSKSIWVAIGAKGGISFGDSGGPLLAYDGKDFFQIGVASDMRPDAEGGPRADYVSVPDNLSWIRSNAEELRR